MYLLAVLGGNINPSAQDLKDILGSGSSSLISSKLSALTFFYWELKLSSLLVHSLFYFLTAIQFLLRLVCACTFLLSGVSL